MLAVGTNPKAKSGMSDSAHQFAEKTFWRRQLRLSRVSNWITFLASTATLVILYWTLQESKSATIEANRAWIAPVSADLKSQTFPPINFIINYTNIGRSPALYLIDGNVSPAFVSGSPSGVESGETPLPAGLACDNVAPDKANGRAIYPLHDSHILATAARSAPDYQPLLNGTETLFIRGCIAYLTFSQPHRVGFCFYLAPPNQFINKWNFLLCKRDNWAD
jgi:hypothetical protein